MIQYILFIIGIALLIKSADILVKGSASLAKKSGVSMLVIGLTIVAFGTSLPELIINIFATLIGSGEIIFGNIIGSTMSNTLLILGIMALITSLKLTNVIIWKEVPFVFFSVLLLFIFSIVPFFNNSTQVNMLNRFNGMILLLFFVVFIYFVTNIVKKEKKIKIKHDIDIKIYSNTKIFLMITLSLFGLFIGGKWTVDGAVAIARVIGLSEFVISATIVAIGTSLPELVTCIIAALKKNIDLAVGNIIGSNILNIIFVLGVTALVKPFPFPGLIFVDLIFLLVGTILLFLFMFIGKKKELDKFQGVIFLILYVAYIVFIFMRG